ncbi:hypothetical protein [Pseudobacteriovorax antillogorgiicola]|uniref:Cytochrome c domain-containing protein n=1 Tax=Pseudobacteriovorax antillogorgiicola TaxID=1513793 RepID=A0A1Y6BLY5_9BACT|nr:hypothetical protein [Pseudobacteriovorax antillogorgiicola]TCS56281.1 hypothetical protein EDD56_104103 [Pseudobacteriovorax antillogorgiicola]SMF07662.1 hypothetical protein SAMN06296036_104230 [Pseudobacteriovorax antillogorgiicola]
MTFAKAMIVSFIWFMTSYTLAEPWLASRFSQNCAGCHAPGRKNKPPADRRCSLSCQGCHVNPNGGGLRNSYGKWNADHWLKSFDSKLFKQKKTVSPYRQQPYAKGKSKGMMRETGYVADERQYDRVDGDNYLTTVTSQEEFEATIPNEDPYYQERQNKVLAGAAFRLLNLQDLSNNSAQTFIMNADMGVRYKPTGEYVSLVHEARFFGQFTGAPLDQQLNQWQSRSLYLMVDDLPYNTFVMGGFYRPLFGNDHPDHTRLSRRIISSTLTGNPSQSYLINYKAIGIGTAPNVPYANLHVIQNQVDETNPLNDTSGFVANLGLRFVTLGASLNYTYWQQETPQEDTRDTRVLMHNLYLTSTFGFNGFHLGLEGISAQVERADDFYRTAVVTLESYYRFWRETYLSLEYSEANAAETLEEGRTTQYKAGIKWFIMPGVELQSQYVVDMAERQGLPDAERRFVSTQFHLFY